MYSKWEYTAYKLPLFLFYSSDVFYYSAAHVYTKQRNLALTRCHAHTWHNFCNFAAEYIHVLSTQYTVHSTHFNLFIDFERISRCCCRRRRRDGKIRKYKANRQSYRFKSTKPKQLDQIKGDCPAANKEN